MTEQGDEEVLWEAEMRATEAFGKMHDWAQRLDLPDPTYDPKIGWTLDQFAMRFEADLLRFYKDVLADLHRPPGAREKYKGLQRLEVDAELSEKVKLHLLKPQFRVMGLRPGSYDQEEISRALLEDMQPRIVVSELVEVGYTNSRRRFEKVRVFDRLASKKSAAGARPTYDWPTLKGDLERDSPAIYRHSDLVEYCRAHVKTVPGKRGAKDGPSDNTIRPAIERYGLRKFIKPNEPDHPGN